MDDNGDASSSLSIPNESIDFDLVYSLHSFAARRGPGECGEGGQPVFDGRQ